MIVCEKAAQKHEGFLRYFTRSTTYPNPEFATTKLLVIERPIGLQQLPTNAKRKGEGGLRTKGYYKKSYRDKPLITVITVVYNDRVHLEETILSVINQPYDNIEYVIIDGESADGTLELIKKYEDCIDHWVSEPDNGLYDAMNKGWRLANREGSILYLGAGDKLLSLPADLSRLKNNQVIYGKVQLGNSRLFKSRVNIELKFANTLHHQALLIPKKLHEDPPFDTTCRIYADFDFNQRLLKQSTDFFYAKDFLAYAMPGGVSKIYSREAYKIANKNFGKLFGLLAYFFYLYQRFKLMFK